MKINNRIITIYMVGLKKLNKNSKIFLWKERQKKTKVRALKNKVKNRCKIK